jgi:hypothetical protein
MPNSLPIYDNIINTINSTEIVVTQDIKTTLINHIIDYKDTHEIVMAIIRYYQLNNSHQVTDFPFYCKYLKTKKGYKFDIDNLPDRLILIMVEFYNLHTKSVENENN